MHSDTMSITPEMLKSARDRLKESQAAFAARFGVDQSTVHRWETDGVPSRGAAAKAIERVLEELAEARP
jgi:DNA-binding transcriptional regulator YiaG